MALWWNGRHYGLKIRCPYKRVGSSPTSATNIQNILEIIMKTDCSDLNHQTPYVQNLEDKKLLKKLKQAEKSENYELLRACQEELYSRHIDKYKDPISDFVVKVECRIIQGLPVCDDDKKMYLDLREMFRVTRRNFTRYMLHTSKTLSEHKIFQMVDGMNDLIEEEFSIEEITEALDVLRKYQANKQNV